MSVDTQVNTSVDDKDINGDTPPPPLIVDGEVTATTTTINNKQTNNNKDEEGGEGDSNTDQVKVDKVGGYCSEDFPLKLLASLDEQLGRPKWVVPVRANDELETLIKASIKLAKERRDKEFEECQRFYREGLTTSFIRILTDDAVKTWKPDIQADIYNNSRFLVELCVYKIEDDSTYLIDLLAVVFNPSCKWNVFNSSEDSTSCIPGENWEESLYARPLPDTHKHNMKGRLVDLINLFGKLGGFDGLKKRICEGELTVNILSFLLRPFGLCSSFLTVRVRNDYIRSIVDKSIEFINSLNDDLLKKEATTDSRSETFSSIMKSLRHLCSIIPGRDDIETFRLKMILRLLQIPSFSGKMNALNEINKIVPSMSYHPHFRTIGDEEQLTTERIASLIVRKRPVYSCTMEGVVACLTGFRNDKELARKLCDMIHWMGGSVRNKISSAVTHVVAKNVIGNNYKTAVSFGIDIMREEWVHELWKNRNNLNVSATNYELC